MHTRGPWKTRVQIAALKLAAPGIDAKHHLDADLPEECMFLLDSSLRSPAFWILAPVFGYVDWLREQDMGPAYDEYRDLLQLFQLSSPARRLTLKAPAHTGCIEVLLDRIPEALVVQTHRDPVPIVSSVNSLFLSMHGALADPLDVGRMARTNLELVVQMARHSMEARERLPEGAVLDVQYDALVSRPVAQVQRIYEHFGLPLTTEYERRLREAVVVRKKGRFGAHRYRAEDFGMTDGELAERFAFYTERFLE